MFENGFGSDNMQWLMCHKTKPNQIKLNWFYIQMRVNKRLIFNWIDFDKSQYFKPSNFVD